MGWNYVEVYLKKKNSPIVAGLRVKSPDSGETFQKGGTCTVWWGGYGFSWVVLYLYKNDCLFQTIAFTSNTGSYSWTIPWWLSVSSRYRIVVQDMLDYTNYDYSNGYFSISIPTHF